LVEAESVQVTRFLSILQTIALAADLYDVRMVQKPNQ
jgi:hypothetical protein